MTRKQEFAFDRTMTRVFVGLLAAAVLTGMLAAGVSSYPTSTSTSPPDTRTG
jgi:hypothetical protein